STAGTGKLLEMLEPLVDQQEEETLPTEYELSQNYPNPFNPFTTIQFYLPQPGHVRLEIYNIMGQEVATIVNEYLTDGPHTVIWNGKDNKGSDAASGLYLYRLIAGETIITKRMMLLK
ncbi:MAG: hypothetical protein DRP47_10635, partial [Candidatus Zixiibacteriota bacterium]